MNKNMAIKEIHEVDIKISEIREKIGKGNDVDIEELVEAYFQIIVSLNKVPKNKNKHCRMFLKYHGKFIVDYENDIETYCISIKDNLIYKFVKYPDEKEHMTIALKRINKKTLYLHWKCVMNNEENKLEQFAYSSKFTFYEK